MTSRSEAQQTQAPAASTLELTALWQLLRSILEQGGDLFRENVDAPYSAYGKRLDEAASGRVEEVVAAVDRMREAMKR